MYFIVCLVNYLKSGAFLDGAPVEIDLPVSGCGNDDATVVKIKLDCFLLGSFVPAPRQSINQLIAPTGSWTSFKTVWTLFNQLGIDSLSGTVFFWAGRQGQVSNEAHATEAPRISEVKYHLAIYVTAEHTTFDLIDYKWRDAILPRDTIPRIAHFDTTKLIMPSHFNWSLKTDPFLF